jgi:cytochrome c oxidase subunit 2
MIQSAPSVLSARGTGTETIAGLGIFLIVAGAIVFTVVSVLVIWAVLRRRGTLLEHAPINAGGGIRWIQIGGLILPVIILTAVFVATLHALGKFPVHATGMSAAPAMPAGDPDAPEIQVTAQRWWWDVRYRFPGSTRAFGTANEIHVPVGETVRISVGSADVIHSFWIPQLHPKIDAIPGRTNTLLIQATAEGTYRGECAEYCGAQHAHMAFVVVAERAEKYRAWLSRMERPAGTPADSIAAQGQRLFTQRACAACHTVRGTEARGTVAPDLTHLASRETIAAGLLVNNRGNLQGWVANAPSLKPGTLMPAMNRFTGRELNALVSFLESLR